MADLTPTPLGDLDAKRLQRAKARAARREAQGEQLPIVFGGQTIAVLEAEFPLDVLAPVQDINLDLALLVQQAIQAATATGADAQAANVELIVNILAANPQLPREFVAAVQDMGKRLLGPEGYAAFIAQRPTPWDVAALISALFTWYGTTLGEFWRSSTSSTNDGRTSNTTSGSTASDSMPEGSGSVPGSLDSSVSAA